MALYTLGRPMSALRTIAGLGMALPFVWWE
jgi:hypothetical protein